MKKVLFVAQNMAMGGIQTSLVNLLEHIQNEYEIDLFVFGKGPLSAQLPAKVHVFYGNYFLSLIATSLKDVIKEGNPLRILLRIFLIILAKIFGSERIYRRLFERQRTSKRYDAAVSYFNDVPGSRFNRGTNLYVSDYVFANEKIAWIHTDPVLMGFQRAECLTTYRFFDRIICVSHAVKDKFDTLLPEFQKKTEVVYNKFSSAVLMKKAEAYIPFSPNLFTIVTVCRVDNHTKRVNGIVSLCKRLLDDGIKNFRWYIVGDGPDLKENQKTAQDLALSHHLFFVGEKENPYPYIRLADLFALYSAFEGYPMVIGEALALSTPILTTPYAAAKEQLNGKNAAIAIDDEDFYHILKQKITEAP